MQLYPMSVHPQAAKSTLHIHSMGEIVSCHRACTLCRHAVGTQMRDAHSGLHRRVKTLTLHVNAQSPDHSVAEEMMSSVYNQRRMPQFLSNAAPDAEVHSGFLDILDSFQQDVDGREPLADTVKELTGKALPFCLLCWYCTDLGVIDPLGPQASVRENAVRLIIDNVVNW